MSASVPSRSNMSNFFNFLVPFYIIVSISVGPSAKIAPPFSASFSRSEYPQSAPMKFAFAEIAEIASLQEEKEFRASIEDAYGTLPKEADNLINIAVVKMLATKLKVRQIIVKKGQTALIFDSFNAFANERLAKKIEEQSDRVVISMATVPSLEFLSDGQDNEQMLYALKVFLSQVNERG